MILVKENKQFIANLWSHCAVY